MIFKKIGLDNYSVSLSSLQVLKKCQEYDLCCFYVVEKENKTFFSTRIIDRKQTKLVFPYASYLYTNGVLGMLLRNFTVKSRLISYVLVVFLWITFSLTIFQIDIYGEKDQLDNQMKDSLNSYLYHPKDNFKMKTYLLNKFKNDVSWLEVYEKGSIVKVRYALKKNANMKEKTNQPLIAKKDGLIASFQCDSGYKMKKVNEMVHKGEVLVNNQMPDSYNKIVPTQVNGKVYAYTWQKVNVEINANKLPKAINYFSMLLEARNQVDISIEEKEKIVKENVLHFSKNKGKIKLEILYTLLEDITS